MKFRPIATIVVCIFVALLIIGITSYLSQDKESETVSGKVSSSVADNSEKITENVFPKDKVIDVKITIDEGDFQSMMDNASVEEVKTASVDYNGMHYDNIGVRTKGNLSLRSVVSMDDSDRYSLKLSFDEYLSSQTLYGISKINLNNGYSDSSYMREYLTYELAEQMGLPTPGYSFVNVYVNDKLWGFYLAVQQVDEQYLESNFGNSYGALYKGEMTGTGSDLVWIDDKISSYTGLAMKSKSSNDDILIDMIDELNNGTDIEKYLDVEETLGYIALQVVTNNTDSYIGSNKQNYYLYEDDGIFKVLPWDYNMAFGGLGGMMGGGGSKQSSLLIDEPTQGTLADRPLVAKLLEVDEYKEKYHEIIQNTMEGYLSSATFKERVTQVSDMISSHVKADPSAFYTYEEYEAGVKQLISTNGSQVSNINQQLDGTIASSGDGSGSGGGMGGMGGKGMGGGRMPTANVADGDRAAVAMAFPDGQAPADGVAPTGEGGQAPADGVAPTEEGGQRGQFNRGQGGFPGGGQGFPGGGGFGGDQTNGAPQGTMKDVIITLVALVMLGLSCVFVIFYKRKRI